jgi:hypothetical protein
VRVVAVAVRLDALLGQALQKPSRG